MTGWALHLAQDECKALGKWFSSRIDARYVLRKGIEMNEMKDLIQRLKAGAFPKGMGHWGDLHCEAADALERLTAGDVKLPELDRELLHDNPNTRDIADYINGLLIDYGNRRAAAAVLAERERIADSVKPKNPRPCDCTHCDCGNATDARMVAEWDEANAIAATIKGTTP